MEEGVEVGRPHGGEFSKKIEVLFDPEGPKQEENYRGFGVGKYYD